MHSEVRRVEERIGVGMKHTRSFIHKAGTGRPLLIPYWSVLLFPFPARCPPCPSLLRGILDAEGTAETGLITCTAGQEGSRNHRQLGPADEEDLVEGGPVECRGASFRPVPNILSILLLGARFLELCPPP